MELGNTLIFLFICLTFDSHPITNCSYLRRKSHVVIERMACRGQRGRHAGYGQIAEGSEAGGEL